MILECIGCAADLSSKSSIEGIVRRAIGTTHLTVLHSFFHQFDPSGVTGIVVLEESHVSIHTWPEEQYAAVDLFTCGDPNEARLACASLVASLRAGKIKQQVYESRH